METKTVRKCLLECIPGTYLIMRFETALLSAAKGALQNLPNGGLRRADPCDLEERNVSYIALDSYFTTVLLLLSGWSQLTSDE